MCTYCASLLQQKLQPYAGHHTGLIRLCFIRVTDLRSALPAQIPPRQNIQPSSDQLKRSGQCEPSRVSGSVLRGLKWYNVVNQLSLPPLSACYWGLWSNKGRDYGTLLSRNFIWLHPAKAHSYLLSLLTARRSTATSRETSWPHKDDDVLDM